jgi:hypothetical protein
MQGVNAIKDPYVNDPDAKGFLLEFGDTFVASGPGSKCTRGFGVSKKNKQDLLNFDEAAMETIDITGTSDCRLKCLEYEECAFY